MKLLAGRESRQSVAGTLAAVVLLGAQGFAAQPKLLSTQEVLGRIEQPAATSAQPGQKSQAALLLADVRAYRAQSSQLSSADAAARWFELSDRAAKIDANAAQSDIAAYDPDTMRPIGMESMFVSLPPPSAWPSLRQVAVRRAAATPRNREALALRFLTELLAGDPSAASRTLGDLESLFKGLSPEDRNTAQAVLDIARWRVVNAYGSPADIAAVFAAQAIAPSSPRSKCLISSGCSVKRRQARSSLMQWVHRTPCASNRATRPARWRGA
jgi:hypothetical protein